jgi:hypothetical protein
MKYCFVAATLVMQNVFFFSTHNQWRCFMWRCSVVPLSDLSWASCVFVVLVYGHIIHSHWLIIVEFPINIGPLDISPAGRFLTFSGHQHSRRAHCVV